MNSKDEMKKLNFDTKCVHAGYVKNDVGALACPIYQTSTFIFDSAVNYNRCVQDFWSAAYFWKF